MTVSVIHFGYTVLSRSGVGEEKKIKKKFGATKKIGRIMVNNIFE